MLFVCRFADQGHSVVGIECSNLGIENFFSEHSLEYRKEPLNETEGAVYKVFRATMFILMCSECFILSVCPKF
jgi:Thiopurine S-methyltransferase (TPMT)